MKTMKKLIRDGKVAILISPGYGAGWYTWHDREELLFDPAIVEMVLENRHDEIESYVEKTYGDDFYLGGVDGLIVQWVPEGAEFMIREYDGSESLLLKDNDYWIKA
jgi:hypothetical protein